MAKKTTTASKATKAPTKRSTAKRAKGTHGATKAADAHAVAERYGLRPGSAVAAAALLLEHGAKMSEIKAATDNTCYSLLKRLETRGHHITKVDGVITLKYNPDAIKVAPDA